MPALASLLCGFIFGTYLSDFSYAYVHYYAGLASAMTALVFLYFTAWIFIYGGELNAAIARAFPRRRSKASERTIAEEAQPDGAP